MPAHAGPVLALALLLAVAGVSKLARPAPTSGALRAAGLPHTLPAVRLLGAAEVVVGVAMVVEGGRLPTALAAAMYAGFAWFVANALRKRLPISSCGCLGAVETPPSKVHVVANLGAVAILDFAVADPIGPWGGLLGEPLSVVAPFLAFLGVTVYLLYAVIAVLPLTARPPTRTTRLPMPSRPPFES